MSRHTTKRIREQIVADRDSGMTLQEIADKYGVSVFTAHRVTTKPEEYDISSFEERWDEARGMILGYRIGWPEEWNEARERLLKGVRA